MNWITVSWPMVAAAALTLGLIELRIGLTQPPRAARVLFSLSAFAMGAFCALELALMRADTIAEAATLLHWMDGVLGAIFVVLAAFIWVYFGTGRTWLALAVPILYAMGAVVDLIPGFDMTYRTITALRTVKTFGGATFNVVEGVPNPWNALAYLGALALFAFVLDASFRLWRGGARRRALIVGGGVAFFILFASVHSALVETGTVHSPYLFSWAFLVILVAMVSELNADVLAAVNVATQLQESERRMELAGAAGNLGMWDWDIVRDTIWATRSARALLGLSEAEILSQDTFTNALHPDDRELRRHTIERALTTGNEFEEQYRVRFADDQIRWISSRGRIERDARGMPVRVRGVVLDISARRRIEMQLQHLQSQLAHANRVSMMGQLASALAHELSQPLGAILMNTRASELFLEREALDREELRATLLDIRRDGQRASNVIDGLRALLKRGSFVARALSVSELLENVVTLAHIDTAARKAQLEVIIDPGLPAVMGEPVHLQQVLLNLLRNATDAVEDLSPDRRKVAMRAARHGNSAIEFTVSDLGRGIESAKLGRLFEPFFTTKPNGIGIGLSISRTIIEAHGGRIWVENNVREGAVFRFTLPLANEAPA
jgi:two-component system, LuxR family, sensor kinase FixL